MASHEPSQSTGEFDRDWTVRPGATLKDWREEQGLSARVTATLCRMEPEHYEALEAGKRKVTRVVACKLQQGTGIPASFWLNYERMYREDLARGRKDFDG